MSERTFVPEWRDELDAARYPFSDTATLVAGSHTLPTDTFLDAVLFPIGNTGRTRLSQITVAAEQITITVGDEIEANLAEGSFDPLNPPYYVELFDTAGRAAGTLVSEPLRLAVLSTWAVGTHLFPIGSAEFVAGVTIPLPGDGLRGLVTEDGEMLTGELWLVGDRGVVFREHAGHIRIDMVGDPLFRRRLCTPIELFHPPQFITTINDCPANAFGDFQLNVGPAVVPDTILRIYPESDGIKIEAVGKRLTQ